VRAGVLEEAPLSFAHPLLRAGVYREIAAVERAEAHRHAARLLADDHASPARVAEHLLAAAPMGDEWVVAQLKSAAGEAAARGAPESAAAYLGRALAEPPAPKAEAGVLLELGAAEFSCGQQGWQHHLSRTVDGVGADSTRIAAALLLAQGLQIYQRFDEAVEVCDRVATHPEGRQPQAHWRLEAMAIACGLLDATTAPSVADRARALLIEATTRALPPHAMAVAAYVAALANEPADQVAHLARRVIALGSLPLLARDEPQWFSFAIVALLWAERYGESQALLDAALADARAAANGMLVLSLLAPRAWLALQRGDLTAAEADARALLEATGLSPPPLLRWLATGVLVEVLVERGAYDQAEHELEPLAADLQRMTQTAAVLRHARARLRVAQRRFREALADLQAVGEIATRTNALSPCFLPWRSDAAMAELTLGECNTARRLSEEELQLARAFGAPRALGVALRAAGLVAGGERGEGLLREAIEVLDGPHTRLEQARALADLGAVLRRNNRRVDARLLLRQAVDAAHHAGAEALASRAETELRATGAKPRRVLLTGLEALTASERRIAELAAEGHTNSEIAQTLFVTSRTVESHLTHVFQKLHINARTELPSALAGPTKPVST
jgi:DNA-binding CsgD family transcriptional regulator